MECNEKLIRMLFDCRDKLIRLMLGMGVNPDDAEELTAEVMFAALKNIDSLRDSGKLFPWMKKIAERKVYKYFERKRRCREIIGYGEAASQADIYELLAYASDIESDMQKKEMRDTVRFLLEDLSDNSRKVLILRYWYGYKYSEIAEKMNLNINTIKSISRRSLAKMQRSCCDIYETYY